VWKDRGFSDRRVIRHGPSVPPHDPTHGAYRTIRPQPAEEHRSLPFQPLVCWKAVRYPDDESARQANSPSVRMADSIAGVHGCP
jgi:hypothetical protein